MIDNSEKIIKKIQKLSVRQKIKNFYGLHDIKYNFILSMVEYAISQEFGKLNVSVYLKIKNKKKAYVRKSKEAKYFNQSLNGAKRYFTKL